MIADSTMSKLDNGKWKVTAKIGGRSFEHEFHTKENAKWAVDHYTIGDVEKIFAVVSEGDDHKQTYLIEGQLVLRFHKDVRASSLVSAIRMVEDEATIEELIQNFDPDSVQVTVLSSTVDVGDENV